jgi:pimeloyl-ACP methyl ester carboxylesterase
VSYEFYEDEDFNFRAQLTLGGVAFGLGDVGEILKCLQGIPAGDNRAWAREFLGLAERVEAIGDSCVKGSFPISAGEAYLRAASYYASAMEALQAFADVDPVLAAFHSHRRCWDAFAALHQPALAQVRIPCGDLELPGYWLSVDGTPRPTLILINGSDGAVSSMWGEMQAALARGYNSLVFDGPGQQSMLFDANVPFRPDWESVLGPVLDFVLLRSDVAADKLMLYAWSQGGYWAARALAFERRIAAAVLDPGVVDVATSWLGHFPPEMIQLLDNGEAEKFDEYMGMALQSPELQQTWAFRSRPYGLTSPFEVLRAMREYNVSAVAHQITTPLFICDPEGEQFWPGQSKRLADLVSGPVALQPFTAAEGADFHCEPAARTLLHQRMFDWFAQVLARG